MVGKEPVSMPTNENNTLLHYTIYGKSLLQYSDCVSLTATYLTSASTLPQQGLGLIEQSVTRQTANFSSGDSLPSEVAVSRTETMNMTAIMAQKMQVLRQLLQK